MARRIRKPPAFLRPGAGLRTLGEAVQSGDITGTGAATMMAPRFKRRAARELLRFQRTAGPPPLSAQQMSENVFGGLQTPSQFAGELAGEAVADLSTAESRAGIPLAPRAAELGLKEREIPLDILQEQRPPALKAADLANLGEEQRQTEAGLRAPIERGILEKGPPLSEAEALGALPDPLRIAPAMERLGGATSMGKMGEGIFRGAQRQQTSQQAMSIMDSSGLNASLGYIAGPEGGLTYSPEQDLLAKISGDAFAPDEENISIMESFVDSVKFALGEANEDEAKVIRSIIRNKTSGIKGKWQRPKWLPSLISPSYADNYPRMQNLVKDLSALVAVK